MIKTFFYFLIFYIFVLPVVVFAQDLELNNQQKKTTWNSSISLGFESKNGNSKRKKMNIDANVERIYQEWLSRFSLETLNEEERSVRTGERYEAKLRTQYNLKKGYREGTYFYTDAEYLRDCFGWYNYTVSHFAGIGYSLLKEKNIQFDTEIGAGYIRSRFIDDVHDNGGITVIGTRFRWDITNEMDFEQVSKFKTTEKVEIIDLKNSLKTRLIRDIYLKLKYEIKHISHVLPDRKKTNSVTTLNLAYAF